MNLPYLPSVLSSPPNSLSMERALKQIEDLLINYQATITYDCSEWDRVNASLDAVETMLNCIERGETYENRA